MEHGGTSFLPAPSSGRMLQQPKYLRTKTDITKLVIANTLNGDIHSAILTMISCYPCLNTKGYVVIY